MTLRIEAHGIQPVPWTGLLESLVGKGIEANDLNLDLRFNYLQEAVLILWE